MTAPDPAVRDVRTLLEHSYRAALEAAAPGRLLAPYLREPRPDFVLAFGKAALPMLRAALEAYPGVPGLAVPPRGTALSAPPGAEVRPGSHPVPDEHSVRATRCPTSTACGRPSGRWRAWANCRWERACWSSSRAAAAPC
ncbi:DUF4147 domain-containing protein [Deinococcus petrolearius]|uniref:DUF4147 domain-containing protein n=1 Tax=Deinococcus petrolearius TaxID=1751295 RepID=A0ABW1DDV9_9DEIO